MTIGAAKRLLYACGVQKKILARRLRMIDRELGGRLLKPGAKRMRILDVGCARGKDFVTLLKGREDLDIVGLDLKDYGLRQDNFRMVLGDAVEIPFEDSYFDITVSIGVLEHIRPIEKLAKVIREINRVSKSYVVLVPSPSTIIEPHAHRVLWQLRDSSKKPGYSGTLIYMSDEAWLAFEGFKGARCRHFWYIPLLLNNLIICKTTDPD